MRHNWRNRFRLGGGMRSLSHHNPQHDGKRKEHNTGEDYKMNTAECPQCGNEVNLGIQPKLGKLVTCKECGAELEVVWLDPLELDWPLDEDEFAEEEDSDDFEEEEY